ncbi:MAG: type VII secretion protein EccCa [Janthinobacterium lividum]
MSRPAVLADDASSRNWTFVLFPVLGSVGMLVIALLNRNPLYLIAGGVFVLGSIGMGIAMFLQMRTRSSEQRGAGRDRYFRHLADVRRRSWAAADTQRSAEQVRHPEPRSLPAMATEGSRLWERRPDDADFLLLRVGRGSVAARSQLSLPEPDPHQELDPAALTAAENLVRAGAQVLDVPVALPVRGGVTTIVGEPAAARALARALLAQLAVLHAPDDVRLAACVPASGEARAAWDWLKWLPHTRHPATEGAAPELLLVSTPQELAERLGSELERRRVVASGTSGGGVGGGSSGVEGPALVVVVDDLSGTSGPVRAGVARAGAPEDPLLDASVSGIAQVRLVRTVADEPSSTDVSLRLGSGSLEVVVRPRREGPTPEVTALATATDVVADALGIAEADLLARRLASLRLSADTAERPLAAVNGLPGLLGIEDVGEFDVETAWRPRRERDLLRVPLGVDADGRAIELDLKESAAGGYGPHGLVVGATGSGKSELLRTLVTGLLATHPPEDLAMVLVDYKGGATFAGVRSAPHVAGTITDLEDDPGNVLRMAEALRGETRRRERLLRDSGNLTSIRDHRARRLAGHAVPAMPHLLVVVDEFAELLAQEPELVDLFVTIGRVGRSLGIHLLLATQRLDEGRLRGLESHLSYRIALRTFTAAESRQVIGTPAAYELPPVPGSAYLKVDTSALQRFRVATVSARYEHPGRTAHAVLTPRARRLPGFAASGADACAPLPSLGPDLHATSGSTVLDVVVDRVALAGPPAHQVWSTPLPRRVAVGTLLGPLRSIPGRGLGVDGPGGTLAAPIGIVDEPDLQRQGYHVVRLDEGSGHLAVVGAPQSGKTTALRSLVLAFALTHTPAELQFYCLDLGGGGLAELAGLPHVGGIVGRHRPQLVRRAVTQISALLEDRERAFATLGIDSAATWRARRPKEHGTAAGGVHPRGVVDSQFPADTPGPVDGAEELLDAQGDVVLVVDSWAAVRADFEELEPEITAIARRGPAVGVHLIIATNRWFDMRPPLKDAMTNRIELRLGDTADSVHGRQLARGIPAGVPGRALVDSGRTVQLAIATGAEPGERGLKPVPLPEVVRRVREAWGGTPAVPVRVLPASVSPAELGAALARRPLPGLPIGLREADLGPSALDLYDGGDPHLIVLGEARAGKTTALRAIMDATVRRYSPEELRIVVVDYRRGLLDAVPEPHLSRYCASAPAAAGVLAALSERLAARLPGEDVTRQQLRERSWWSGARALVVVDDLELLAMSTTHPLTPLLSLLPVAADIGLHLVVAQNAGGAATALLQPTLRRVREAGTSALLLSGPPEEGNLVHGARFAARPPGRAQLVTRRSGRAGDVVQLVNPEEPV